MKKPLSFVRKIWSWGLLSYRGFNDSHSALHAAGLTYFSMLAIVPILCCVLVVAKVAHVDRFARDKINEHIDRVICQVEQGKGEYAVTPGKTSAQEEARIKKRKIAVEEFATQARQFSDQIFSRIDKFNVRRLGVIGLVMLLWTVVSSLGHVEVSLNEIWGVRKGRPLWKKVGLYLFVAIIIPVLAALAMSMPILNVVKNVIVSTVGATAVTRWASDGIVWFLDSWFFRTTISVSFASLAFGTFLWLMPNHPSRFRHAWYGGLLTAVMFIVVLKVCAVAQVGIAKSSAVYGSFAFLPIVMAWFYMSWQVVLLGASMTRAFAAVEGECAKLSGSGEDAEPQK